METRLYHLVVIVIPAITVAGQSLVNVYGRIKLGNFDFEDGTGVIGVKIGEKIDSQITYMHDIPFTIPPSGSISANEVVQLVLAAIPNSSILQQ